MNEQNNCEDIDRTVVIKPEILKEKTQKVSADKTQKVSGTKTEKTVGNQTADKTQNSFSRTVTSAFGNILSLSRTTTAIPIYRENTVEDFSDKGVPEELQCDEANLHDVTSDYDFGEKFAEGGQGVLSHAEDIHFRRSIAVKSLRSELHEDQRARKAFIRESVLTAHLDHPSIVPVYGLYKDSSNGLHLAMKMVQGQTLKKYLKILNAQYSKMRRREVRINEKTMLPQRLTFFLSVCDSVSFIHHKHLIHRDLKPENIMIGDFNETYIMDLGIAEKDDRKFDPDEAPSGTIQYIAPEVIARKPYDKRSDIFLLGLILYEIVCLKTAYPTNNTLQEAVNRAARGETEPVENVYGVPVESDMRYIIQKALAPDPDDRYQTVAELSADLKAFLSKNFVKANPHVLSSRLRLYFIHHARLMIGVMMTTLLLFMSFLAFFLYQVYRNAEDMRIEDAVLTDIYARGIYSGRMLDVSLDMCEYAVSTVAGESAILLESQQEFATDTSIFRHWRDGKDPKKAPEGSFYSEAYKGPISANHIGWTAPGRSLEHMQQYFRKLAPLLPMFSHILTDPVYYPGTDLSGKIPSMKIKKGDMPYFRLIFLGLHSGEYFVYPYKSDYADDLIPQTRPWYIQAIKANTNKPVWGDPYYEIAGKELVITCSARVLSRKNGATLGVIGADISMKHLADMVEKLSVGKGMVANMVLDSSGRILLDTCQREADKTFFGTPFSNDNSIFERMKKLGSGRMYVMENGVRYLYFFMRLNTIDWYYVQKIDFRTRMESFKNDDTFSQLLAEASLENNASAEANTKTTGEKQPEEKK